MIIYYMLKTIIYKLNKIAIIQGFKNLIQSINNISKDHNQILTKTPKLFGALYQSLLEPH